MSEPATEQFITFEEFSKVHLKVGKVIHAESMQGMKKVFKAKVDLGTEQRELAVGGAQNEHVVFHDLRTRLRSRRAGARRD